MVGRDRSAHRGRNALCAVLALALITMVGCVLEGSSSSRQTGPMSEIVTEGQRIFRFDTFGDEQFWTDKARLHEVIEQQVQPLEALRLGLKVDLDNLNLLRFVLHNPFAVSGTKELLRQNAVVGVQATFDKDGNIAQVGITCALCHSTVDNSLLPGIGHRLDGWANRDLDVGAIIALSPAITAEQKAVYRSWGPGQVRPALQPGRKEHAARPSAGVRAGRRQERDVHGGRTDLVLERVRCRHADARAGQLLGSPAGHRRQAFTRSGDAQACRAARVSAQPCRTAAAAGQLRRGRGRSRSHAFRSHVRLLSRRRHGNR